MGLFSLLAVTVAAATALGGVSAAPAAAAFRPCAAGVPAGVDFDGDGAPDAAIGVPGRRVGDFGEAGLIEIRYGDGGTFALTAARPAGNDNLGWALQPADLNGDACTDLIAGAPFSDASGTEDSGAVYVFLGKPDGFHQAGILHPGGNGIPGSPLDFAYFGWALGLDRSVLYIGEPCAAGDGQPVCAGAATRVRLTITDTGGVTAAGTRITEDSPLIGGKVEGGEGFGSAFASLDGKMAIGAPGEGVGGAVYVVGGTAARKLTQDTPGMPGAGETGDEFGMTLGTHAGDLVIGSPFESIGPALGAGMITVVPVEGGALRPDLATGYSQNSPGVAGAAEWEDWFGWAVGTWNGALLVGSPGETVGDVLSAGMVVEVGTGRGWTQNTAGIPGAAGSDARFGISIGALGDVPLVGAIGTEGFRGAVIAGLDKAPELWRLSSGASHEHQEYGRAIS